MKCLLPFLLAMSIAVPVSAEEDTLQVNITLPTANAVVSLPLTDGRILIDVIWMPPNRTLIDVIVSQKPTVFIIPLPPRSKPKPPSETGPEL